MCEFFAIKGGWVAISSNSLADLLLLDQDPALNLSCEIGFDGRHYQWRLISRIVKWQLSQLIDLSRHQPKTSNFCSELVLHRQLKRSAMYGPQIFSGGIVEGDCAIAQRKAKKFYFAVIRLIHSVVPSVLFCGC